MEALRPPELVPPLPSQVPYLGAPSHPFNKSSLLQTWFEFEFCYLHPKECELECVIPGDCGTSKLKGLLDHIPPDSVTPHLQV